jgi:hypothetical protein
MAQRKATHAEVEETLRTPFAIRPARAGCLNYYRRIGGFALRVTVKRRSRLIVTVWKEPIV